MADTYSNRRAWMAGLCLLGWTVPMASGCVPMKSARVAAVGLTVQDVAKAASKQSDLLIVREGTPAYLMLLDGLLEAYPDNEELLIAASQGTASYASSFLSEEERDRAAPLYRKAKLYAFTALSDRGDFGGMASGNLDTFRAFLDQYTKKDVPKLFWAANAWASWISMNVGSVEAMADLAALEATIQRILALDDTFYYGGPHLLMGVYLAAKPSIMGGDLNKAKRHFDRALALGGDALLMSRVLFAEYYARGVHDQGLYESTLKEVLEAPADRIPELTLANTVAKEKARRLLEKTEEYFESQP